MLFFVLFLSLVIALLGFLGLSDRIQLLVDLPREFSYLVFLLRFPLMVLGFLAFLAALYWGVGVLPEIFLLLYILIFLYLYLVGFILQPYLMYPSKQYGARYVAVDKAATLLSPEEEVIVFLNEGAAVAFPISWITRTRVVGVTLDGQEMILTYCVLAQLGKVFLGRVAGKRVRLRVLNQLENNLVLIDENSQQLIEHIYGVYVKSRKALTQIPSIQMPFSSFADLYPYGMVYHNPPYKNLWDKRVRRSIHKMLYKPGGHMDPANSEAAYPTIGYIDQRIPSKEQVYGLSVSNEALALTLDYIKSHGNCAIEELAGQTFTFRYFPEYKFVDIFQGDIPDVDPKGFLADGSPARRVPHANRVVWIIWSHFYPHTVLKF